MKSNLKTIIVSSLLAVSFTVGGFVAGLYFNLSSLGGRMLPEHVHNGMFFRIALEYIETQQYDKARNFLRSQLSSKIGLVEVTRSEITRYQDDLIADFYRDSYAYFEKYGRMPDQKLWDEQGKVQTHTDYSMQILDEFNQREMENH